MTTNRIDQLAEWWETAEHTAFEKDDLLIARFEDRPVPYEVYPAGCDSTIPAENVRILARAPKPKPAWHDAVAVIAYVGGNELPRVLVRDDDAFVDGLTGYAYMADRLRDVTPLIEAKVTDEMVKRAVDRAEAIGFIERVLGEINYIDQDATAEIIAAALGSETK